MLKKQDKILKNVSKKVSLLNKKNKIEGEAQLPAHHFKKIKVKRGIAGLGLYAGEDIKKGSTIVEYIGNILTAEEAEKKVTAQYLFEINSKKTIDGTPRWNTARYCNHSCGNHGNAESDVIKGRVFIKAIKNIKEGEEITYDYGKEFFDEHIKPHGCKCKKCDKKEKAEEVKQ